MFARARIQQRMRPWPEGYDSKMECCRPRRGGSSPLPFHLNPRPPWNVGHALCLAAWGCVFCPEALSSQQPQLPRSAALGAARKPTQQASGVFVGVFAGVPAGVSSGVPAGVFARARIQQEMRALSWRIVSKAEFYRPRRGGSSHAAFAPTAADDSPEPGFPRRMPYYYRHTSLFRAHAHARALMRLRCCSDPFAASPTLHYDASPGCMRCAAAPPETAEHALLDCPSFSRLRAEPRFAALFASPLPPGERLRAFVRLPDQFALAEFVHTCFEDRSMSQ